MRLIYEAVQTDGLRLMITKEHYEKLTGALEEASRTRHDMRQYIPYRFHAAGKEHYEQLREYFHQFAKEAVKMQAPMCYCKNMSVDAILHYYAGQLEDAGVSFHHSIEVPKDEDYRP